MPYLKDFNKNHKGEKLYHKLKYLRRELKYAWQRAWRGYDDIVVWSTFSSFLEWIIPVLKDFERDNIGQWLKPVSEGDDTDPLESFYTVEEIAEIVREMYEGFEVMLRWGDLVLEDGETYKELSEKVEKAHERAMGLFNEHFYDLWI